MPAVGEMVVWVIGLVRIAQRCSGCGCIAIHLVLMRSAARRRRGVVGCDDVNVNV
jgi:hypothetical protein